MLIYELWRETKRIHCASNGDRTRCGRTRVPVSGARPISIGSVAVGWICDGHGVLCRTCCSRVEEQLCRDLDELREARDASDKVKK